MGSDFEFPYRYFATLYRPPAKCVYVEGNVAAGKTAFILEMKRCLEEKGKRVYVFVDQTERWTHQRILSGARSGTETGCRAFHTLGPLRDFVDRQRFVNEYEAKYDYIIMEQHPRTTLNVFGASLDDATRELFETIHAAYAFMDKPKTTVHVNVSPKECYGRLCRRVREGEQDVNLFYIQSIEKRLLLEIRARINSGLRVIEVSGENITPRKLAEDVCDRII